MSYIKKYLFFIPLCVCCYIGYTQNSDTIFWNKSYRLKFDDFKSTPDFDNEIAKAISYLGFTLPSYVKNDTIYINLNSYFVKKKSWFIKEKKASNEDKNLLAHEQGHFDIKEISIRKFKKTLMLMSFNSFKQFNENYSSLIKKLELEDSQLQKQYDKETDLSRNVLKQKEWNIRIAKELKELENYSSSIIKIPLKKK